jgi:hypothetical protein
MPLPLIFFLLLILSSCGGGGGGGGGSGGGSSSLPAYTTTEYYNQYGLDEIYSADAYSYLAANGKSVAGDGVAIAILDTGVQIINHQEVMILLIPIPTQAMMKVVEP